MKQKPDGDHWPATWKTIQKELDKLLFENLGDFRNNFQISKRIEKVEKWWYTACQTEKYNVPADWYVDTLIGNPKVQHVTKEGKPITYQACYSAFVLSRILSELPPLQDSGCSLTVLEVGPGFGDLAALVCKHLRVRKYYLVDAPPMNKLQQYYLTKSKCLDKCSFEKPTEPVDLIISTFSLGEMPKKEIEEYIALFEAVLKPKTGLMYLLQRKDSGIHPPRIGMTDYPFDKNKWDLDIRPSVRFGTSECFGRLR
jgi:hypothetical protein